MIQLKHKGALDFNEGYSDIILDSVKLCLLTTNQNMNSDDLIKQSSDLEEDCYKKKLWNKCEDLISSDRRYSFHVLLKSQIKQI